MLSSLYHFIIIIPFYHYICIDMMRLRFLINSTTISPWRFTHLQVVFHGGHLSLQGRQRTLQALTVWQCQREDGDLLRWLMWFTLWMASGYIYIYIAIYLVNLGKLINYRWHNLLFLGVFSYGFFRAGWGWHQTKTRTSWNSPGSVQGAARNQHWGGTHTAWTNMELFRYLVN